MATIIDGKELAKETREKLKIKCNDLKEKGIVPKLAVIMVGDNKASQVYVRNKSKACDDVGIQFEEYLLEKLNSIKNISYNPLILFLFDEYEYSKNNKKLKKKNQKKII